MGTFQIVKAAIFTPLRYGWGIPTLLKGPVGVGKTAQVEQVSEAWRLHFEPLILSLMESVEGQGHPYIHECDVADGAGHIIKKRQMDYAPPGWASRSNQANRAVIFLDELNMAQQATFAAFMRVVNERACGAYPLAEGVRFIGAMNPTDVAAAAGGVDLPMAFANRWCHLDADLAPFDQWANWLALKEGVEDVQTLDPAKEEARVMKLWPDAYAAASAEVIGFLAARPNRENQQPDPSDPAASGAWASRRSWSMATRARASAIVHGLSNEDAVSFESGCVGRENISEMRKWVTDQDLPNAREWLRGEVDFTIDRRRLDRTSAFLISCAIEWARLEKNKRAKELERLVDFYGELSDRRDVLANSVGLLTGGGAQDIKNELLALPQAQRKIVASIGQFKTEAGAGRIQ